MTRRTRYSQEVRERAVRMVFEHEGRHTSRWAAISSIASKIGCSPEALRKWVHRSEIDSGHRAGVTTDEQARMKDLERENRELRRANEIHRMEWAFFAPGELARRPK
jgi:transposase